MAKPIFTDAYTRIAAGGETIIAAGDFTNVKQFLVWGVGLGTTQAIVQSIDTQTAVLTMPPGAGYNLFSVWAVNTTNETSDPIYINKAEIRWVQQVLRPGETAHIMGLNLAQNKQAGTNNAYVWFKPVSGGNAIAATVKDVNPFRISYTVPALVAGQQYDIYVHNGHGGFYGLSEPYRITASAAIAWGPVVPLLGRVNGDISDVERFERAWSMADAANNGTQITFNETLYFHRPANCPAGNKIRVLGGSKTTAKILPGTSSSNNTYNATLTGLLEVHNATQVHFENITFDLQGRVINQFINGISAKFGNGVKFINCDLNFYGVQPLNIENSNDTHLLSVNSTGRILYVGNANQTFMDEVLLLQTHDATSGAQIWGGAGFFARNVTTQDYYKYHNLPENQNDPAGWGMGRRFSGNGSFGGQINWHIEDCNALELTPRTGTGSDPNSGEIDMWEGNQCRASGKAYNISADGKTFSLPLVKNLTSMGRAWAIIVGGKGLGQYNLVLATPGSNTVTVAKEWKIKPDTTSVILVGHYSFNIVTMDGFASGKDYATSDNFVNASSGFKPFGGAIESYCVNNHYYNTRTGIQTFVTVHNEAYAGSFPGYEPVYWNYYEGNRLENNRVGLHTQMEFNQTGDKAGTACVFGTVARYNTIIDPVETDVDYGSSADLPNGNIGSVFEYNWFTENPDLKPLRGSLKHVVYRNNNKYIGSF